MSFKKIALGLAAATALTAFAGTAPVQAQESIFVPLLTYRTGPFGGSGVPIADGMADYLRLLNERDGGIGGVKLLVDPVSLSYLKGAEVDFVDTITGGGFTIKNPNASSTCGCGSSFSA